MNTEYINYRVWSDGSWVSAEDYVETDYEYMSDDWFLLPLPITFDEDQVGKAIAQALQGVYPNARL